MNSWANFKPDAFQLLVRRRCHQQLVNIVSLPRIFEMAAPNPGPLCAVGPARDSAAQTGAFSHASWTIADNLDFDAVQSVPGHILDIIKIDCAHTVCRDPSMFPAVADVSGVTPAAPQTMPRAGLLYIHIVCSAAPGVFQRV